MRDGLLVFVADRLQTVKWRNDKVRFYQQETMVSPAVKLGVPLLFDLYVNPREEPGKSAVDSWVFGPVPKMVGAFGASTKKFPPIPLGTPDPSAP